MAAFSVKCLNDNTSYRKVYIVLILLLIFFPRDISAWTSGATNFVVNKDGNSMNTDYPFIDQSDIFPCPAFMDGGDYSLNLPKQNTQCRITDIQQDLDPHYHFSAMSMPNGFVFFAVCLPSYVPIEHHQSNLSHFSYSKDDENSDAQNGDVVSYHETTGNVYTPNR